MRKATLPANPPTTAAPSWLGDILEPTVAAVPAELRAKLEPAELFHEVLEHKVVHGGAGRSRGRHRGGRRYVADVLPTVPDERLVLDDEAEASTGWIGYG